MVARLVSFLKRSGDWMTRAELTVYLEWSERAIRLAAEAAGDRIVRGPRGFNHIDNVTPDDLQVCAERFVSQGKKMIRVGLAWKRRAHQKIG